MDVAMSSLSLYDLNLWTKSKKSPSFSFSLSSSPKLKTRHYKTTIFSQNLKKQKKPKHKKGDWWFIVFFLVIFFPLRIQSLRNVDSSQILKVRREEKRREAKSSPYFELCVVPWRPRKQGPQVWKVLFSCPSSYSQLWLNLVPYLFPFFSFFSLWDWPNLIYIIYYYKIRMEKYFYVFFSFYGRKKSSICIFFNIFGGRGIEILWKFS